MGLSGDALLHFEATGKAFRAASGGELRALDGLSFALAAGEFVSVIGPSGCGKSSLLRLAAGLETPSAGRVLFRGRPLDGPGRERGMVFQNYNAFPWLTVRQNIAFGLAGTDELRAAKAERWLALTGLGDFAESYPKALSGGMRQRLALARTLVMAPALLLLDEPFGALDEPVRRSMQHTLLDIVEEMGCAVLFVTHDIGEAIFLGDRVILMSARPGRVLDIFSVPAAKPRRDDFVATTEFNDLYAQILGRFPNSLERSKVARE